MAQTWAAEFVDDSGTERLDGELRLKQFAIVSADTINANVVWTTLVTVAAAAPTTYTLQGSAILALGILLATP